MPRLLILMLGAVMNAQAANVCISIPNAQLSRVIDDICTFDGYQAVVVDTTDPLGVATIPNPETKAQFAQRMIAKRVKDVVVAQEDAIASKVAISSTTSEINTDIPIQ